MAKQLDVLPTIERRTFVRTLEIGKRFVHKGSGREWEIKQIHRKDGTVELTGPGVDKKITKTFDQLKREWRPSDSS